MKKVFPQKTIFNTSQGSTTYLSAEAKRFTFGPMCC